jgi:hypothetical protein
MLDDMARQAAQVKAEHDELGFAKDGKRAAQVELLRAVVDAVRPALPALCSRMQNVPGPIVRALNVAHNLYLGESGGWIEVRDGGTMLLRRTSEEIVVDYVVEDIADALSNALTRHAGSREWSTTEIRHEAERLRAAVMLLRPVPR